MDLHCDCNDITLVPSLWLATTHFGMQIWFAFSGVCSVHAYSQRFACGGCTVIVNEKSLVTLFGMVTIHVDWCSTSVYMYMVSWTVHSILASCLVTALTRDCFCVLIILQYMFQVHTNDYNAKSGMVLNFEMHCTMEYVCTNHPGNVHVHVCVCMWCDLIILTLVLKRYCYM